MTHVYADNYTDWLYETAAKWISYSSEKSYHHLIVRLDHAVFYSNIPRDSNRIDDAISLWKTITGLMDDAPPSASVLEVMISLAMRCENDIMHEPRLGDRSHLWFWMMIESLGLVPMDDENYDPDYVTSVIDILNRHEYAKDGNGGLFTVKHHPEINMRKTEVWYQMQLALHEYLGM